MNTSVMRCFLFLLGGAEEFTRTKERSRSIIYNSLINVVTFLLAQILRLRSEVTKSFGSAQEGTHNRLQPDCEMVP